MWIFKIIISKYLASENAVIDIYKIPEYIMMSLIFTKYEKSYSSIFIWFTFKLFSKDNILKL
jgi:hypothetical protein